MNDRGIIHDTAERLGWFVTRAASTHTTYAPTDDPWDNRRISIDYDGPRAVKAKTHDEWMTGVQDGLLLTLILEHLRRYTPTTEETPPMSTKTAVNASRDGVIDLALDNGWVLTRDYEGLSMSKTRNGSPIQFVLHFDEDGNLERVEYSDGEKGTSDWIPDDPQERAFQLCRTIVGPGGHVPDPELVKLREDVRELERRTNTSLDAQRGRLNTHYDDITRIGNKLDVFQTRSAWALGIAMIAIIGEIVLAIAILVAA